MKFIMKTLLWIIGIAILCLAILTGIGINMKANAEGYLEDQGFKNVHLISTTDTVLCKGEAVGLAVYAKAPFETDEEGKMYPICVTMTGDADLGTWE